MSSCHASSFDLDGPFRIHAVIIPFDSGAVFQTRRKRVERPLCRSDTLRRWLLREARHSRNTEIGEELAVRSLHDPLEADCRYFRHQRHSAWTHRPCNALHRLQSEMEHGTTSIIKYRTQIKQDTSSEISHTTSSRFGSVLNDQSWSSSDIPSRRREMRTDRSVALPPLKHSLFWRKEKEPRAEGEERGR